MALPARERVGTEDRLDRLGRTEVAREVVHERDDVLAPIAQRRQPQHDNGEPVIEVVPEAPGIDLGAEVAIGRRDHARADLDLLRSADAAKPAPLEHAEQR